MLMPSIFGESLFDDFMDFPFGGMKTNMSGKLSLSVELNEGREVEVKIVRK